MQLKAWVEITRPFNGIMGALAVLVGFFVSLNNFLINGSLILGLLSVFFILSAGMMVNDFFDRFIDKKKKPRKPIPSERISAKHALYGSFVLFFVGIILSVWADIAAGLIALVNSFLLVIYSKEFSKKPLVGNVIVAFLVGSSFVFGAAVAGNVFSMTVFVLAILAFLSTLAREVFKDCEDIEADKGERKTLPITIGEDKSSNLAGFLTMLSVLLSPVPFLIGLNWFYLAVVVVADAYFLWIIRQGLKKEYGFCSRHMKYAQALVLIGFLAGIL